MLQSAHWHRHLDAWARFTESAADDALGGHKPFTLLNLALAKAGARLTEALEADDDRYWHKFRIAVKDVHYLAIACKEEPDTEVKLDELIKECRSLQTLLGSWHDTIIQLHLIEELAADEGHAALKPAIEDTKHQLLSEIHDTLADSTLFTNAL